MMITKLKKLRDPFLLAKNGVYYAYGTGVTGTDWANTRWTLYRNDSGDLAGDWEKVEDLARVPEDAVKNFWAPEVWEWRGAYYMFTTYFSKQRGRKGCTVLRSQTPEGPFVEISDGLITPAEWECLDGTLYVDEKGLPYLIFVKEWKCTEDRVGRMMLCRLSEDLTRLEGEITQLFAATDAPWCDGRKVTDGCFLYKTEDGALLMIWSNYSDNGYAVGIARSQSGRIEGPWLQEEKPLYSRLLSGDYDGGHGMIFTAFDGKCYLALHSPNKPAEDGTEERVILLPLKEEKGTLVWDR